MSNRKQKMKASLGITEYPWSSDDEEDGTSLARDSRQNSTREQLITENMPSTSGMSVNRPLQSSINARRQPAQTSHPPYPPRTVASTSRAPHGSTRATASTNPTAPTLPRHTAARNHYDNRPHNSTPSISTHLISLNTNGSRITTTIINGGAPAWSDASANQNNPSNSGVLYTTSYSNPRPSWTARSPSQARPNSWTTPSMNQAGPSPWTTPSTSQARSSSWTAGPTNPTRTSSWNTPSTSQARPSSWNTPSTSQARPSSWNAASTSRSAPQDIPTSSFQQNRAAHPNGADWARLLESPPSPVQLKEVYEWRNESLEMPVATITPPPENQCEVSARVARQAVFVTPKPEPSENPTEEAEDLSTSNTSSSGVRLIEEVVEVAAPDETETLALPVPEPEPEQVSPVENSENSTNVAAITAVSENAVSVQPGPSYQGVKRKRDSNDDRREPFSVHDFNQNLLRLLECPVCLEWMEPPISQCRRGHLVCGRCRTRLSACPVCRTPFSSVRNRAMEGVAEMLRYPCRHGCGREVRLRRRGPHESSCTARRYQCPAPDCTRHPLLQRDELMHHFQCKHLPILKIGRKHKFSMKVNAEQHDTWLIMTLDEYFHMRVDVDIRTWGVIVYVSYIGPKKNANHFYYEVTVQGQHNSRKLVYTRTTHSDLESSSVNVSRQDCFHLTLDQALNFLRIKNRHCEPDKFLDFDVEITKSDNAEDSIEESD